MKFISQEQEQFYKNHADITAHGPDYEALIYTLGISPSCRAHFSDLYDPATRCIKAAALAQGWQTGASKRITRLAFNLFTWQTAEGDDPTKYTPKELFSGLDGDHRTGAIYALMYFA